MSDSRNNVIFHIDVNSAFLSWEAVRRLRQGEQVDLRSIPSAVGGDMEKRRGIIYAKSVPAKQYGVKTGEPVIQAKRKCPGLVLVSPDHTYYEKCSSAFMDILREYSPVVEPYSIDEAFMDMSGMEAMFGNPAETAETIRNRIRSELEFTVNIGISDRKMLAKMASDFEKPDRVHTLFVSEIQNKMWPLPVSELFLVGGATLNKLSALGIRTIGELAQTDRKLLTLHLKKHGDIIWKFANGLDESVVEEEPQERKGYGNSTTIAFDVTDVETAKHILLALSETVSARLRHDQKKAEQISVTIKDFRLHKSSHQMTLRKPVNTAAEVYEAAVLLFKEAWDKTPIRLLGIQAGKLIEEQEAMQLSLFTCGKDKKQEKLEEAMDRIRGRYGTEAVKRASFLESES